MKREVDCDACARSWTDIVTSPKVRALATIHGCPVEVVDSDSQDVALDWLVENGKTRRRAFRRLTGADGQERLRIVRGELWRSCVCDSCGATLLDGTEASCVSLFSERRPYFEWEHEFLRRPGTGRCAPIETAGGQIR